MDKVTLSVNGSIYGGWKSVKIIRSITSLCGSFSLGLTDQWNYREKAWPLKPGYSSELMIDSEKVLTGFLDKVEPSFSATTKTLSVAGRDKTLDLIDCSVDLKSDTFTNIKADKLIEMIVKPYGIQVITKGNVGEPFSEFSVQRGESGVECIEKIAKQRGLLVTTDTFGRIVILDQVRGRASTSLVQGQNILSASGTFDQSNRFSQYKVQSPNSGSQFSDDGEINPEQYISGIESSALDAVVKRYRPLLIMVTSPGGESIAKKRAQWEATIRAAQSSQITVEVQGWRQGNGSLWEPNTLVPVKIPWLGIENEDLLISEVSYSLSESGSITSMNLVPEDAFKPEPVLVESKGSGLWKELS